MALNGVEKCLLSLKKVNLGRIERAFLETAGNGAHSPSLFLSPSSFKSTMGFSRKYEFFFQKLIVLKC